MRFGEDGQNGAKPVQNGVLYLRWHPAAVRNACLRPGVTVAFQFSSSIWGLLATRPTTASRVSVSVR